MGSTMETTKFQYTWILWYHDPDNKDYSFQSYIRVADVQTPQQFWTLVDSIPKEAWVSGMFFFMRHGYRPLWDVPENDAGGAWSKKIESSIAYSTFVDMMVHCVSNSIMVHRKETIVGVTISPKGPFSILKVWNTTTTVADKNMLSTNIQNFKIADDVTYTAHKSRPK